MKGDTLIDLGFSKNEAKTYLSLIQLGPSTAGSIAAKANIHRTNVYDALDRLTEKGVVSYIFKGNKKYFQAVDPEQLMDILKERVRKFESVLPTLQLDYKLSKERNRAHIFEGIKGIKAITNDILHEEKSVVAFGIPKDMVERIKNFVSIFHKRRIEKKIEMKHLYDADARERIDYLNTLPYTEAAFLEHEIGSPATTTIYGDKVAFYIWSDPPVSILIESKKMAEQYKKFFDLLWNIARQKKTMKK